MKHVIKFSTLLKNQGAKVKHNTGKQCFICGGEGRQYHADRCGHKTGICTKCAVNIEAVGLLWCDNCDPNL